MTDHSSPFIASRLPTARELYDFLMGPIEPDLLFANLPLLNEKYGNEAPPKREARMERYQKAFDAYDEQYEKYMTTLTQELAVQRTQARKSMEGQSQSQEEEIMESLEQSMAQ